MNNKAKYLKYKTKYLQLKNKIGGSFELIKKTIYKSETGFPIVIEHGIYRYIVSDKDNNSVHTSMEINDPYNTFNTYEYYMLSGLLISNKPENYLLIGLGGGYTAKIILKLFPDINLDIVEYNHEIPIVAKEYFKFIPSHKTKIYINDGVKYIMDLTSKKYDIISLDAYTEEGNIPSNFLTDTFFNKVKMHLSDNGLFIINSILDSVTVKNLLETNFKYYICIPVSSDNTIKESLYNKLMNNECEFQNYVFIASISNFINRDKINTLDLGSNLVVPEDIKLPIEDMRDNLIFSIGRKIDF